MIKLFLYFVQTNIMNRNINRLNIYKHIDTQEKYYTIYIF